MSVHAASLPGSPLGCHARMLTTLYPPPPSQIMRYVNAVASRAHVAVCRALKPGMMEYEASACLPAWVCV